MLSKIDYNNTYPEYYKICEFIKGFNNQVVFFMNKKNSVILEEAIITVIATKTGYQQTFNNLFQLNNQNILTQNFSIPIPAQNIFNLVLPVQQLTSVPGNNQSDIVFVIQKLTKQVKNINSRNTSNRSNNIGYNYRPNNNN